MEWVSIHNDNVKNERRIFFENQLINLNRAKQSTLSLSTLSNLNLSLSADRVI